MKLYKVTVLSKSGKVVEPYPRIYRYSQGVSAVKGYWLSKERSTGYEAFHAPYSVKVETAEVPDDSWQ
jgi:hypothetical protein